MGGSDEKKMLRFYMTEADVRLFIRLYLEGCEKCYRRLYINFSSHQITSSVLIEND
jgi:hypothetical protein